MAAGSSSIRGIRCRLRGLSDFNAFHQINANLVYQLPFGKGQTVLEVAQARCSTHWSADGTCLESSAGPPASRSPSITASPGRLTGISKATPCRTARLPKASNPKNAIVNGVGIGPDIFADPAAAEAAFRPEWPGESGVRNNVIGDGMFNIDTGVSKDFSLGEQRRLEFSWQAFNATNSVRYDVRGAQPSLSYDPIAVRQVS